MALAALESLSISIAVLSTLLFFLLLKPPPNPIFPIPNLPTPSRRRLLLQASHPQCQNLYTTLHFCLLSSNPLLSLPILTLLLLLDFYFLAAAAGRHFSPAVSRLAARLRLSPSMAAVTLLALGNGAPDVFASVAAVRAGQPRTGLAAILSAGAFVSAFVVGSVAVLAAPFPLDPAPFVRDVAFYFIAAFGLFYVYLSAEIYLWQAAGLILYYLFFVGLVIWMDRGGGVMEEVEMRDLRLPDSESGMIAGNDGEGGKSCSSKVFRIFGKIAQVWEVPIATLLKLTIPSTSPSEWSKFYAAANIGLCPLALLYSLSSFISLDRQIVFLIPESRFPLWSIVLFISTCLAVAYYLFEKEGPSQESKQIFTTLMAFVMSVFWISTMAGELLNCLVAVGTIMDLPPAILGLTVLAWGNSVGDLVADVALAKAGQPAMAMAGCFVGPMFNMLIGLGIALVIETAKVYPGAYKMRFHISIVVAFVFLLLSLMGSLLVFLLFGNRVPRFWGFCLVGLYTLFTAVSLAIAKISG